MEVLQEDAVERNRFDAVICDSCVRQVQSVDEFEAARARKGLVKITGESFGNGRIRKMVRMSFPNDKTEVGQIQSSKFAFSVAISESH